jgi:hypothetical protein
MSDTLLEAALSYARAGFPLFPAKLDKSPLTEHGFKDASRDEDKIRAWWAKWPQASIGIPTGAGTGIVVLDEDPRHGGTESLEQFVKEHGALLDGPVSRTGGGGRHFFFRHPGGNVPNAEGIRPGLDVRGDGGYVVVPPSPHKSGTPYSWLVPLGPTKLLLPPPWLIPSSDRLAGGAIAVGVGPDGKVPAGKRHTWIVSTAAALVTRMSDADDATLPEFRACYVTSAR